MSKQVTNANFPLSTLGKTYHLDCKPGDSKWLHLTLVAQRILTVGSSKRADLISSLLSDKWVHESDRGFKIYTGHYQGQRISIVSVGNAIIHGRLEWVIQ